MGSMGGPHQFEDIATGGDELWRLRQENAQLTDQLAASEQMRQDELEYMQQNYNTVNDMFHRELEKLSSTPVAQTEQLQELTEKLAHMEAALRESIAVQEQQAEMLASSEETISELQEQAFKAAKDGVSRANSSGKLEMENMHLLAQLKDAELALTDREEEISRLREKHSQQHSSEPALPASMAVGENLSQENLDLRQRLEQAEQDLAQQRFSAEYDLKQLRDEVSLLTEELEVAKEEASMLRAEKEELQMHRQDEDLYNELPTIEEDASYGEEIIEVEGSADDELNAAATTVQRAWRKRAASHPSPSAKADEGSLSDEAVETAGLVGEMAGGMFAEATEAELDAAATTVQRAWRRKAAGCDEPPQGGEDRQEEGAGPGHPEVDLQELQKDKTALIAELQSTKEAMESLKEKNSQLTEDLEALNKKLSEQDTQLQENLHTMADLREQQLMAQSAAAAVDADAVAQEEEAMELAMELENTRQSLGSEIKDLKRRNSELQQGLEAQRSLGDSLNIHENNGTVESALESSTTVAIAAELNLAQTELVDSKSAAESRIADLETEMEKLKEVNESLRAELSSQVGLLERMKDMQSAPPEEDVSDADHLGALQNELETTKELLAAADAEQFELQAELRSTQDGGSSELPGRDLAHTELYDLQQQLQAAQEKLVITEAQKTELEDKLSVLLPSASATTMAAAAPAEHQMEEMRAALSSLETENARLQQELQAASAPGVSAPVALPLAFRRESDDVSFQADKAIDELVDGVELEQPSEATAGEEERPQLSAYAAEMEKLKATLADRTQQLTDMQSATDYAEACAKADFEYESEKYTKRISQLQKSLGDKSKMISELKAKIDELSKEPQAESAMETPAVEAEASLKERPETAAHTAEVASLTTALEEKADTISKLEAKLLEQAVESSQQLGSLSAALKEKTGAMDALEAKLTEMQEADASNQRGQFDSLVEQVESLSAELEEKTQSIQQLEAQLILGAAGDTGGRQRHWHHRESADDAEDIQEMVAELHEEIWRLQDQQKGPGSKAAPAKPSAPQEQPWYMAPESTEVTHLQEELSELHAMLEEKATVVSDLQSALEKKTLKVSDLSAAIYDKDEQLAAAVVQLKEAKADLRETTIQLEGSQPFQRRSTRRSMMRDSTKQLGGELTKAFDTMGESIIMVNDARTANMQADVDRLKDENANLADELEEQRAMVADLSVTCEQLDGQCRAAMELSDQRKREITKLVAEALDQSAFVCDLKSDGLSQSLKLQEAQERCEELEREVAVMRAKANGLASVLDEHEPASLDTLRRRLRDAEAALHKKEKSLRTVSEELRAGQKIWKDMNKILMRDPIKSNKRLSKTGVQELASQPEPSPKKNRLKRPKTPPTPPVFVPNATRAAWGSD